MGGPGDYRSLNSSYGQFSWQTMVSEFFPRSPSNDTFFAASDRSNCIMGYCTQEINQLLNINLPAKSNEHPPSLCVLYQLRGSFFADQAPLQGHAEMVCATTTQINAASSVTITFLINPPSLFVVDYSSGHFAYLAYLLFTRRPSLARSFFFISIFPKPLIIYVHGI